MSKETMACTLAVSAARLTVASMTPGTAFSAFSTRDAQDAHVVSPISSSSDCMPTA